MIDPFNETTREIRVKSLDRPYNETKREIRVKRDNLPL
jgi:hypothetical protein